MFFELPDGVCHIAAIDDVVAAEDAGCLPAADAHGERFRNARTSHVACTRAPQVVEQKAGTASVATGIAPGLAKVAYDAAITAGENMITRLLAFGKGSEQLIHHGSHDDFPASLVLSCTWFKPDSFLCEVDLADAHGE